MDLLQEAHIKRLSSAYHYLSESYSKASRKSAESKNYESACKQLFQKTNNMFKARLLDLGESLEENKQLSEAAEFIRMSDLLYPIGYEMDVLELLSYRKPIEAEVNPHFGIDQYCIQYMRSLAAANNLEKNINQIILYRRNDNGN